MLTRRRLASRHRSTTTSSSLGYCPADRDVVDCVLGRAAAPRTRCRRSSRWGRRGSRSARSGSCSISERRNFVGNTSPAKSTVRRVGRPSSSEPAAQCQSAQHRRHRVPHRDPGGPDELRDLTREHRGPGRHEHETSAAVGRARTGRTPRGRNERARGSKGSRPRPISERRRGPVDERQSVAMAEHDALWAVRSTRTCTGCTRDRDRPLPRPEARWTGRPVRS